jgi:PKD repeat protein
VAIDWGDGTTGTGTVSGQGGAAGFQVSGGDHVYQEEGNYNLQITVTTKTGNQLLITSTVQVDDAPLTGQSVVYGAQPGLYQDVVGSFTDANNAAVPGEFLAMIDWGDGSTSTGLVTGSGGLYAVSGQHDYVSVGTYAVEVQVSDVGGSATSWCSTLYVGTTPPAGSVPLLPTDPDIAATEGQSFTAIVGTFTDSDGNHQASAYHGTVSWGDGGTSVATISGDGPFTVTSGYLYKEENSYTATATIQDNDGWSTTITCNVNVTDAALTLNSVSNPSGAAGSSVNLNASITDAASPPPATDFKAVVAWGDGQSSVVSVTGGPTFTINVSHVYAQGGTYKGQLTVTDDGGSSVSSAFTSTITGIIAQGTNPNYVAGVSNTFTLATFTDSDGNQSTGPYLSNNTTVDFGDGSPIVTYNSPNPLTINWVNNQFVLQAPHLYSQEGYYPITVKIVDTDGATATVISNANVTHAALTATNQVPSTLNLLTFSGTVATFSDGDSATIATPYSALIQWGDSQFSWGTINYVSPGSFSVSSTHTFATTGSDTVTVLITDSDGSTVSTSGTVTISQTGPLAITPAANLSGTEGMPISNLTLATFTDTDGNTLASAYANSTINWGDGNTTSASITGTGPFTLAGSHTYAEDGSYRVIISVIDSDGAQIQAAPTLTVADAALSASGTTLSATAGTPLSAVTVGSFTDAYTAASMTDDSIQVNWGDNSPMTSASPSGSGGSYNIVGGHLYATAGTFTATITVTDKGGQTATASTTINVAAASTLTLTPPVGATEAASWSGNLGTFTPTAGISGDTFVAYIAWGDGGQSIGTLTSNGLGGYTISSSHTYADESNANNPTNLAIVVQDTTTGLVAAQTTASVTIADAALTPTPQSVSAWVNKNTGTIVVGRFSDANTSATAADFSLSPVYWGDGQSSAGTVVPIGGGQFNILAGHTYTTANTYTPYVTVTDVGGSNTTVTSTATVAAPTTSTVNPTENSAFSGTVASFTNAQGSVPQSANIVWGDGTNSASSITIVDSTHFNVTANPSHTYADEGTYNLLVTVTMSVGGPLTAAGPAVVADAALTGTGNNFSLAQGQYLGFVAGQAYTPPTIATFSDANTNAPLGDFTASINLGDGNTIAGTLATNGPAGSFKVLPASPYTYAQPGSYTITTTVTDKGSTAINLTGTATVGVIEGQQYFAVITAPLPDPITTTTIPSYTAVITWGDNSTSAGTATPQYANNGTLTGNIIVTGSHQYTANGNYTVYATVTNTSTGATSTSANKIVTVVDAALQGIPQTLTAVSANSTGTISVAQFRDLNPLAMASQFPSANVTINWGDGSGNQTGSVVAVAGATALFAIQGSHTYASAGSYTVTASATDTGGKSVSVTSTISVNAPWTLVSGGGSGIVRTSDPDRANLIPIGEAAVDLNQGACASAMPSILTRAPAPTWAAIRPWTTIPRR